MKENLKGIVKRHYKFNNPVINKLINGMAWNVVGTVLSKVFLMIASIATSRILGVDKNGEYSIINSTVLMFSTLAALGLGTTATRFVSEYKTKNKEKCGRVIGMTYSVGMISGIFMTIVLFFLAPWLSGRMLNAPHLVQGLRLAAVLLITNTINVIQQNTLSGFERFKTISKLSIIQGIISLPIFVLLTYLWGVNGLVLGHIIVSLISMGMFAVSNSKVRNEYGIKINFRETHKEIDIMLKFSLPSMLSNLMVGPITWIGNAMITAMSNGYFELGIFNAANQWRTVLTFIPAAIGNVILPLVIANKGEDRLERINILLGWIIVSFISIPILAFPEIIAFLYGRDYAGTTFNISILLVVLTCCILSYKEGIARNLVSNNLMWWGFLSNSIWGASFLLILIFTRWQGAIGLATAYLTAYIVSTIVFVPFYIKKRIVHKSLIISKEILLMWMALITQLLVSVFLPNAVVRITALAFSLFSLWNVTKTMLKKEKLN